MAAADVDTITYTTTKVRKTKKTTKRRESTDGGGEITITEVTEKENHLPALTNGIQRKQRYLLALLLNLLSLVYSLA